MFSLDMFSGVIFDGYTRGEDWNGFACPYFTFEQANQIVAITNENGIKAQYIEAEDAFMFVIEQETEMFYPARDEIIKLYPIGAFCWIWNQETEVFKAKVK